MSHPLGLTPVVVLAVRLVLTGGVIALILAAARRR
jgi:hypothetical protein